jgi:16S rRNA (cytosine967-C5)-methyltransferase
MTLDPRAAAASAIGDVIGGQSLNQALPPRLAQVADRDRAFLQQLCYGALRDAPKLFAVLDLLLQKPLRERDADLRGLLLAGLHQLESMRVPDHAAVASTVSACAALKKHWARGLVNAVLRRYQRERDTLLAGLDAAAAAAHPRWLYDRVNAQWPDSADAILAANNTQPPMTLRVNRARTTRGAYLDALASAGIAALPGDLSPEAVRLAAPCDVHTLPGFDDGECSVQDEAAQLAAHLLDAQPGDTVLDACAAPGGKACHTLELEAALGELVAMDIDAARLQRVQDNLERLALNAEVLCADAANPGNALTGRAFDRILVDAPCSATGVIRRHPDIKLLRREDDIAQLAAQQRAVLDGLWPLLKPGGTLLYVTCSILREENEAVVTAFVDATADARVQPLVVPWGRDTGNGRQLLPATDGPDGLFFSLLRRAG